MSRPWLSLYCCINAAFLALPIGFAPALQAQTQWQNVEPSPVGASTVNSWEPVPTKGSPTNSQHWEPLSPEIETLEPEQLVWTETTFDQDSSPEIDSIAIADDDSEKSESNQQANVKDGFRWPNGQLMNNDDQIHYRSAWSRGSMIQIGDTVYPNIGMNALQRAPGTWGELGITAIDDSWQWFGVGNKPNDCTQGNFVSVCADAFVENKIRIWDSNSFSAELNWTIHSLSGEGAPFNISIGNRTYGREDSGTAFGGGQSIGFRIAKNFGKTFGISAGGKRLWHFDDDTDLSKPFFVTATKIFRLKDTLEPPIISLTFGLMSDVYNPDTVIGTVQYPDWLLGGRYPSLFAEKYDGKNKNKANYPNVAGVSSAFVCAEETIFATPKKNPTDKNKDCIKKVFVAPVGSVGFAPWPWLGFYANFTRNLNLGISLKPFKNINWNISAHMISPIAGLNSRQDRSIKRNRCGDNSGSFSACRTRIGLWTELSF